MNKNLKILGLAFCGAAVLGVGSFALSGSSKANAETELIIPQEYTVESEYDFGDTFVVPAPSSVSIKTGTVATSAVSVVLSYPDGTAKSEGNYTLDKTGTYSLTYYNANGVSVTQSFVVNKNYYDVGEGASATYETDLLGREGREGIEITLKDGKSFTFNKTINLNDYAGQALEVCKIFPMFRTDEDVNPDASTVSVKLVDCYDATKFVEFYIWCGEAGQGVYYMGAGASTQVLTGLEQNFNRPHEMTEAYEGDMYKIHRPQRYQSKTAWGTGMSSKTNSQLFQREGLTLIWDLATHKMQTRTGGVLCLMTDIDSAEIYGASAIDFDSFFTTGEVYLNVEAYNYTKTEFTIGIEEIFGKGEEYLENGRLVDNKAPEITVDVEPTKNNTIYLQKGKEMVLPKIARVLDFNYYGKESVAVYRNYGKPGQVSVNVQNGVFVPEMLGNYTAVYSVADSYGNVAEYRLDMVSLDEMSIEYEVSPIEKLVAAKANVLPGVQASGLNKAVEVSVSVTTPNGAKIALDHNGADGYEYVPEYVGDYTVTYCFKDNVYEEYYSYNVACVDENSAAFQNPFKFPAYFMKGASYTVEPVTAYTAGNGGFNENAATVSVSVDGGAYQTLTAVQMQSYKVEANETLRFKASYGDSYEESQLYKVVDVGYGKKTTQKDYVAYMQGNYEQGTLVDSGAQYVFSGDASLQFLNTVSSSNFKMNFKVVAATVESVVVTLRDVTSPKLDYVTYTYKKAGASVMLSTNQYVNGKLAFSGNTQTKYASMTGDYTMTYSVAGMATGNVVASGVKAFEKDGALVEINVVGAAEGCEVLLSQLNNQAFSTSMRESKPQISYKESNGVLETNSIHEIAPCYASSVLCSVLKKDVKVTVLAPNDEVAVSVDGIRLENVTADRVYQVKLSSVGQYRVNYEASCVGSTRSNGQETLADDDYYIVNVSEGIAPQIKFTDGSNEQTVVNVAVGSSHTLKEFTVTDNTTATENIKIYTMILDKYYLLEEDGYGVTGSYVFKNVGEYKVCVIAIDELGNRSTSYYNVVVS